jgi:chemotaxis response regulator CheB
MPVLEVEHGMRLEPGLRNASLPGPHHSRQSLSFAGSIQATGWPKTINIFLCSLAEAAAPRAVAVILSGRDHNESTALTEDAGG